MIWISIGTSALTAALALAGALAFLRFPTTIKAAEEQRRSESLFAGLSRCVHSATDLIHKKSRGLQCMECIVK
jgi:hypothetical protein